MQLRDYQERSVREVLAFLEAGRKPVLVAPTGAGKTVMGREIVTDFVERGLRVVWIAHRRELIQQAIKSLGEDMAAGIAPGFLRFRNAPAQVATFQTLLAGAAMDLPPADVVVIDEAHHIMAEEWLKLGQLYERRGAKMMGLTATPERADGKPLGFAFDAMVVSTTYGDLLARGILTPCRVYDCGKSLDGLAQDPVVAYQKYAAGRKGFLFCSTEKDAVALAEQFTAAGIPAMSVSYRTAKDKRRAALEGLTSGEVRILTNVYALTEGVDIPSADLVILARGYGHLSQVVQSVGRGIRGAPGKRDAMLLDLFGVCQAHKWLPGYELDYSLDGSRGMAPKGEALSRCKECWAVYQRAPVCPVCGHKKEAAPRKVPTIYNEELREIFNFEDTPPEAKAEEADRLVARAKERGYSYDWVVKQYKLLFNEMPPEPDGDAKRSAYLQWKTSGIAMGKDFDSANKYAYARYRATFGASPPWSWRTLEPSVS